MFSSDERAHAWSALCALGDHDLQGFGRLEGWPRGPLGSWVIVNADRWRCLAQWDAGSPDLWPRRAGLGLLTIERILREAYASQLSPTDAA